MDELNPKPLIEKFKKSEQIDENEVKKLVKECAQCLQYLHSIGVSHNNLRSSSVVDDKKGVLKVVGLNQCAFYWDSDNEKVIHKKRLSKKSSKRTAIRLPKPSKPRHGTDHWPMSGV